MKRARTETSTTVTRTGTVPLPRSGSRKKKNTGYKISLTKQVGLPRQLVVRHRYSQFERLTSTTGVIQTKNFRCNGMFDPDASATGHQPMYFDQISAIYNHFTVVKSNIKVTFTPEGGSSFAAFGVFINDDTTVTPTILGCLEQSSAQNGIMTITTSDPQVRRSYWDAVKAFGPSPLANDNLQGSGSADPTEQQVWTIWCGNSTATTVNIAILVEIEYTAVWDELKDVDVS